MFHLLLDLLADSLFPLSHKLSNFDNVEEGDSIGFDVLLYLFNLIREENIKFWTVQLLAILKRGIS